MRSLPRFLSRFDINPIPMKRCKYTSLWTVAVPVCLLALALLAIGVLSFSPSLSVSDIRWLAFSLAASVLALFLLTFRKRVVYIQPMQCEDKPTEAIQADQPVQEIVPEQPIAAVSEPPVEPEVEEVSPVASDAPSENPLGEDLRAIRTNYLEPFTKILEEINLDDISEDLRKEIGTDLLRIAFLYMDYTNLVTRPTRKLEREIIGLATGTKSFPEVISQAKEVTDDPAVTPKVLRSLKALIPSDGETYYFLGYRF